MSETTLDQILLLRQAGKNEIVNVDEATVKLVIFELAGQHFAFHGDRIREIIADAEVYFVPGCPDSLEGVINVRGDIESVIHINAMLNLQASDAGTILLGRSSQASGSIHSGIRIDRVIEVMDVVQSRIQPPLSALSETMRPFVIGMLEFDGLAVFVLDLERLFSDYVQGLG